MLKFYPVFLYLEDAEVVTRVYWSGFTKSGCAGQYSNCFEEEVDTSDDFQFEVVKNKGGGACVAVTRSFNGLIAKALPCDSKVFLACQIPQETAQAPVRY